MPGTLLGEGDPEVCNTDIAWALWFIGGDGGGRGGMCFFPLKCNSQSKMPVPSPWCPHLQWVGETFGEGPNVQTSGGLPRSCPPEPPDL